MFQDCTWCHELILLFGGMCISSKSTCARHHALLQPGSTTCAPLLYSSTDPTHRFQLRCFLLQRRVLAQVYHTTSSCCRGAGGVVGAVQSRPLHRCS